MTLSPSFHLDGGGGGGGGGGGVSSSTCSGRGGRRGRGRWRAGVRRRRRARGASGSLERGGGALLVVSRVATGGGRFPAGGRGRPWGEHVFKRQKAAKKRCMGCAGVLVSVVIKTLTLCVLSREPAAITAFSSLKIAEQRAF